VPFIPNQTAAMASRFAALRFFQQAFDLKPTAETECA
jgi:hypothetical protein